VGDTDPQAAGRLSGLVSSNASEIVKGWVDAAVGELRGRSSRAELERNVRALQEAVLAGLAAGSLNVADEAFDMTRSLLAELSRSHARQGFTPRETAVTVFALKDAVLGLLGEDPQAYRDYAAFSRLVDSLGLFIFETYAAAREQIILDQSEQLLELSTPVVKLWDGIVAVPLVGTLDSARTQVVMERLLQTLVDTGSEHAIIDITGVPAVDTQVAQHLLKTVAAARLMGAECVISGIRPQIAQTIVTLGIEFGDIRTKATLADALLSVLRSAGVMMTRAPLPHSR
jgi:rsbT co-antagonist protein RsbR